MTAQADALAYAARGWPVLPLTWPIEGRCSCGKPDCQSRAKHPLTAHGAKDATTDADVIRQWWDDWPEAGVGVATGDGLLVLDVDPRHGGGESLRDVERDLGPLPPTVQAVTGGGGLHVYFAADQDYKNRAGALGPGLDVRSGGAYVVAVPSLHVSGQAYAWEVGHAPDEIDLADLPPALAARLQHDLHDDALRPAAEVGEQIPEGQRHDTLVSLAGTMRRRGMSEQAIAAALLAENEGRCDPPLPEAEVEGIAASVATYPPADEAETPPEPAGEPPDLADCLADVVAFIRHYVVLSDAQVDALALWTVHTHAFDAAAATPYLSITSPEKRSGKTLLEEALALLVARPWLTGRVTAAVLVRKAGQTPTLLLDESDAAFRGEKEYAEALRAILNSGHRRHGVASLCVKAGADFELRDFPVFCPKAIAGIGRLPDTVADRSIAIRMKRKAPNEPVARFRWREAREEAGPIRTGLEAWTAANIQLLEEARPDIPPELDDRAQDGWEPLLAIADATGGEWPMRARRAALILSVGDARDDDSLGVRLLQDVRSVFEDRDVDRLPSATLVSALVALEEAPWGDLRGKQLTARGLARMLKPYDIRPRLMRISEDPKRGYERADFDDAWGRYAPTPELSVTSATSVTKQQPRLNLDGESVTDVTPVTDKSGIQAPTAGAPPDADSGADQPWPDGADADTIPPEFTGKRHAVVALGIELDFPNIYDRGGGIPAGRHYYLAAARTFSDAEIDKAVAVLEALAVERKGN